MNVRSELRAAPLTNPVPIAALSPCALPFPTPRRPNWQYLGTLPGRAGGACNRPLFYGRRHQSTHPDGRAHAPLHAIQVCQSLLFFFLCFFCFFSVFFICSQDKCVPDPSHPCPARGQNIDLAPLPRTRSLPPLQEPFPTLNCHSVFITWRLVCLCFLLTLCVGVL